MRESGTTKMYAVCLVPIQAVANSYSLQASTWTSNTARTVVGERHIFGFPGGPCFLQIIRSGTNMLAQASTDLQGWVTINTTATTSAFTTAPDQAGIIGVGENGAAGFDVLHFKTGT
jgi:hypothetical protein